MNINVVSYILGQKSGKQRVYEHKCGFIYFRAKVRETDRVHEHKCGFIYLRAKVRETDRVNEHK